MVFRESFHQYHLLVIQILVTNYTITKQLSLEQPPTNTQKVDSLTFSWLSLLQWFDVFSTLMYLAPRVLTMYFILRAECGVHFGEESLISGTGHLVFLFWVETRVLSLENYSLFCHVVYRKLSRWIMNHAWMVSMYCEGTYSIKKEKNCLGNRSTY